MKIQAHTAEGFIPLHQRVIYSMVIQLEKLRRSCRWALGLAACSAVIFHVIMTFIYLVPGNIITRRYLEFNYSYMAPLFAQNWHLFSPNPGFTNMDFWIKCTDENGNTSSWQDPFRDLQDYHHKTRVTGVGKLLYIYGHFAKSLKDEAQNSLALLHKACATDKHSDQALKELEAAYPTVIAQNADLCSKDRERHLVNQFVKSSSAYANPIRFARKFCYQHYSKNSIGTQLRVVETFPKKFSERHSKKRYGHIEVLDLDPDFFLTFNEQKH